jgi:hypothetical protein
MKPTGWNHKKAHATWTVLPGSAAVSPASPASQWLRAAIEIK